MPYQVFTFTKTVIGITAIGKLALDYVANPSSFPNDCPDPRVSDKSAQAFANYCKKHLLKK